MTSCYCSSEEVPIDAGVQLLCALLKLGFTGLKSVQETILIKNSY